MQVGTLVLQFDFAILPVWIRVFAHEAPRRCPLWKAVEISIPPPGRKEAHMDNKPVSVTEKVIGDTLYIIESTVSDTAKETAYDKLKRMILGEVESQKIKLAS